MEEHAHKVLALAQLVILGLPVPFVKFSLFLLSLFSVFSLFESSPFIFHTRQIAPRIKIFSSLLALYCLAQTYSQANFTQTIAGQISIGTCLANYYSVNVTRSCGQSGDSAVWGTINNPCQSKFISFLFS